ncbi:MAG: hypothetical protein K2N51_14430 [Lachnospiraceae bacterium]|nr:hypothetical protein [Lachnospiraceae bacterium]
MNPVFLFLVFIGLIFLWFLLCFAFVPIGRFLFRLWTDAKCAMEIDNKKERKDE